jgi:hypothetical protein
MTLEVAVTRGREPGFGLHAEVKQEEARDERRRHTHEHLSARHRPSDFAYSTTDVSNESVPSLIASVPEPSPARDRFVRPQHPHPSDRMTR